MLFWQRKSTHKRFVLWAKLAGLSTLVHVLFVVWFFFIFKDKSSRLSLIISPDLFNRNIEFTIASPPKLVLPKKSVSVGKKAITSPKKAPAKKVSKPANQTTVAPKKNVASAPKKQTPTPKKPAAKQATHQKAAPKPVVKQAEKPQPIAPQAAQSTPDILQDSHHEIEVHKIGLREKGLLEEFKALHEDIVSKWAPPPGIADDCSCQISVLIDWKGGVKTFKVIQSSGVLMYDTSAQKVLTQIEMPRWTWGKELTITFNQ